MSKFDSFSFQSRLWESLKSEVSRSAVSHAYLFYGLSGSGKKTMAHAFLMSLMCESPINGEPCGQCENCLLNKGHSHPDAYFFSSADKKTVSVDHIRGLISDVYMKPFRADRKVYVIEEADKLTMQAQNALLKVLEEPPSYAVFLLVCENVRAVMDTVLSRVIKFPFEGATDDELRQMLLSEYGKTRELDAVISFAGGSVGRAKEFMENGDVVIMGQQALTIFEKLLLGDETQIFTVVSFFEKQKEQAGLVLDFWLAFLQDMIFIKHNRFPYVTNKTQAESINTLSQSLSLKAIVYIMDEIKTAQMMLARYINVKEVVYHMLLKIGEDRHE